MSPPSGGSHSFEKRLAKTTKGIITASQPEPGEDPPFSQVMLIADELLVASHSAPIVQAYLKAHNVKFARLTSLLQGLKPEPPPSLKLLDVEVWRLLPPHPPVIKLVEGLWQTTLAGNLRAVTPNHVLIPASWSDQCPFGPPLPTATTLAGLRHPGEHKGSESVTVIDAGSQWDPRWPANPLDQLCQVHPSRGGHPVVTQPPLAPTTGNIITTSYGAANGNIPNAVFQGNWKDDDLDGPDAHGHGRLDALAGHANFVTGVLGQYASFPTVSLWNHYGGFYPDPDEYTRELSVCRSLIASHLRTHNPLINLGFAFVPLKGKDHVLSIAWDTVFTVLGRNSDKLRIITPAGNQGSSVRHYPAALNTLYPGRYPNVMGVASHDPGQITPSLDSSGLPWSNHGGSTGWVACSAIGSDVESTFLHVAMRTEDDIPPYPSLSSTVWDFRPTDLARWSGTCFAAPKVTGSIAAYHTPGGSLDQAWTSVTMTTGATQTTDMGWVLPF